MKEGVFFKHFSAHLAELSASDECVPNDSHENANIVISQLYTAKNETVD
jgi:hypothetical protein